MSDSETIVIGYDCFYYFLAFKIRNALNEKRCKKMIVNYNISLKN